jgi:iron complex outermembrane recepter protein
MTMDRFLSAAVIGFLSAFSVPVFAQTDPVEAADPASDAIVVTARRREESLQDVPLPVSVFSEKQLTSTGAYNISRVAQIQPVIQFYASNPRNSSINIRGLGAPLGLTNDGIEQGVGLYIDQVYYSRPASSAFDFIDTQQVEVLRGPQGTLYGKNTTAGAINIRTRAPSFSPEARVELTGGNYDFFQGKASVSGPLGDTLAARIGVSSTTRRGTVRNVLTNEWTNSQDNFGVRSSILFTGVEHAKLTLSGDYAMQNPRGYTQVAVRTFPTLRNSSRQFNALTTTLGYKLPSSNPYGRVTDVDSALQSKQYLGGVSLLGEFELGENTLTSVTAWRFWTWRPKNDRDFIGLPITTLSQNNSDQRQLTQEFRFATSGQNKIDFVAGVFGYRQTIKTLGLQEQGIAANVFTNGPLTGTPTQAQRDRYDAVLNGLRQTNRIAFENNSLAGYGQATWNVTDKLRIQPGLRANYDTKDATYDASVTGGVANPTAAEATQQRNALPTQFYTAKYRDFNISGDINISWRPIDDVMLYGVYSRSFKSGGLNLNGLPTDSTGAIAFNLVQVKPEQVNHFEAGVKAQFWGRRITTNITAYRTNIDDYQTTVTNGSLGVARGYLANADVRIEGFEGEFIVRPTDWFNAYANIAYNNGTFRRFTEAPIPPECTGATASTALNVINCATINVANGNKDISGARFPGISKWSLAWGGEASLPIGGNESQLYVGADASYRSAYSSNATPSQFFNVDAYSIANFRAGYRDGNDWNVFGWVKNAFKTKYLEFLSNQPGNNGLVVGQLGDPRTYGFTVAKKF